MRVVILGPGAAGKSTFSRSLARATGVPSVELDKVFWSVELNPTPAQKWVSLQASLVAGDSWILDGDLGPYDVVDVRLARADTVVLFDPPVWRCIWRSLRRSRERWDYWRWLLTWRHRQRPAHLERLDRFPELRLFVVRSPDEYERVIAELVKVNEA